MNPIDTITSVLVKSNNPIVTTSFGPHSAVLLHMITKIKPNIPVVWIDTQFATPETLDHKDVLCNLLNLNLHTFVGQTWTSGIPESKSKFEEFATQIKLAPFKSAMSTLQPSHWFSAIRREETPFREQLTPITKVGDVIKISPLLHWTTQNMDNYIQEHQLPTYVGYYDPSKITSDCECGIHAMENF